MATKKKVAKWIREQTKKLPPDTYEAGMKLAQPKWEEEKDEEGKVVARRFIIGDWGKFPVNHARRAKRAYKREGQKGLSAYFLKYGFKLIKA